MDRLLYISYCVTNVLFYVGIKYIHLLDPSYSTAEIATYCNIISFVLVLPYAFAFPRKVISGFKSSIRLSIMAPAAFLKFVALQYIPVKNAMVIAFITPFVVTLLSFFVLGEHFSLRDLRKYLWMFLSFVGVIVFIGVDFHLAIFAYFLMLMHVAIKGFFHIFTKQLSKEKYVTLFYGVFYNMVFMLTSTAISTKLNINPSFLFDWHIILIGMISVICQLSIIAAYKTAVKISFLQNLDYSRLPLTCLFSFLLLGEWIVAKEFAGMFIIILSILGSDGRFDRLFSYLFASIATIARFLCSR